MRGTPSVPSRWVSVGALAKLNGMSTRTVRRHASSGRWLTTWTPGGHRRIAVHDDGRPVEVEELKAA